MNDDIIYIIKESSDPKLVGKKLVLEYDTEDLRIEKYILTIFEDSKDVPYLRARFTYIRLNLFLETNQVELIIDNTSTARFNRCLKEHTGLQSVWNIHSGLPIFGTTLLTSSNKSRNLCDFVNELNKGDN